ncbi:hypothetical protein B0T25DRAFT_177868 [Lasiosphaeria hispida]|uniref:Uncharacterized protein n=1 Tax=Lasiosphaeria hispida TaxID=260671 RepID=A0AAJ0HNM3_9PEZI|nr:hypothetical protein B0T25DRAFT_177868 [Lasiosphaeria hispida]
MEPAASAAIPPPAVVPAIHCAIIKIPIEVLATILKYLGKGDFDSATLSYRGFHDAYCWSKGAVSFSVLRNELDEVAWNILTACAFLKRAYEDPTVMTAILSDFSSNRLYFSSDAAVRQAEVQRLETLWESIRMRPGNSDFLNLRLLWHAIAWPVKPKLKLQDLQPQDIAEMQQLFGIIDFAMADFFCRADAEHIAGAVKHEYWDEDKWLNTQGVLLGMPTAKHVLNASPFSKTTKNNLRQAFLHYELLSRLLYRRQSPWVLNDRLPLGMWLGEDFGSGIRRIVTDVSWHTFTRRRHTEYDGVPAPNPNFSNRLPMWFYYPLQAPPWSAAPAR